MSDDERPDALPPGRRDEDDDAVWAGIVASFHASPSWAEGERGPYDATPPPAAAANPPPPPRSSGPAGTADAPDPADHFVPPVPGRTPPLHPVTRLAWAGTLGGPLLLLGSALVGWRAPQPVALAAVLAFLAGVVTLVARMRDGREERDGDDGAVV